MAIQSDLRIARLMDKLEDPALSDDEVARIKSSIEYFESKQRA